MQTKQFAEYWLRWTFIFAAMARHFAWDYRMMEAAASACNAKGEVAIVIAVEPKLFLVPATKGHGDAKFLITDLLKATAETAVQGLHFTHFGFLQGRLPESEIAAVIDEILNPRVRVTLPRLVFDIDARAESSLYGLMRPRRRGNHPPYPRPISPDSIL